MKGRPRTLPAALLNDDFVSLAHKETDARVRIRLLGLAHLQEGKSYAEVSRWLKVDPASPKRWVKRLVQLGLAGLKERPGRGRKSRLPADQVASFRTAVNQLREKRKGGRSRALDIQQLLVEQFQASYSLPGVYHVLHRSGLSWITAALSTLILSRRNKTLLKKLYREGQRMFAC